ncbi:transposase [Streptomyces sparsogenes]|uniref:transposase n=1 Tax=Streptomyces sparsogenes TaxID=67365 RepID=UPI0033DD9D5F
MLRVAGVRDSWWEVLPEQARQLPAELARIDAFLDDERFIAPWRAVFDERIGRPSVPVETLLRLLYLKHRYQLGYETLCREVADSLSWRRFCRIPLTSPVPHPTTLIKRAVLPTGRPPGTVVADRGFGTAANDLALAELGVQRVGLQRAGKPGEARREYEQSRRFRRMRNWRVGIEARISHLKRSFGFRRTRLRRLTGAQTWAGLGIFAYNLHRMTVLSRRHHQPKSFFRGK